MSYRNGKNSFTAAQSNFEPGEFETRARALVLKQVAMRPAGFGNF